MVFLHFFWGEVWKMLAAALWGCCLDLWNTFFSNVGREIEGEVFPLQRPWVLHHEE